MEIFLNCAIPMAPLLPKITIPNYKCIKARAVHCFGKNGEPNGLSGVPLQTGLESHENKEMHQDLLQPLNSESEKKDNDIWKLFREAQQNILHLNKQRLMAIEEVQRLKSEKKSLLDKIEQFEANVHTDTGKGENGPSVVSDTADALEHDYL
ncbi:unnamed protein product [Ilex paraguariensis]|uniref:Uncharacterized protein n=1 Tax=Ilex paraguariensis TaxID=185542 RepID=A0ABC8S046_9AQUA